MTIFAKSVLLRYKLKTMKTRELLVRAGFSRMEGRVYEALDQEGPCSISQICRVADLHRPTVYRVIKSLRKAKLVEAIPLGKRLFFKTSHPSVLERILLKAENENSQVLDHLLKDIPLASGDVKELHGAEGLRAVLDDLVKTLKKGEVFYRYSSRAPRGDVEKYIPKDYRDLLKAKKIEQFVIANEALRKRPHKNRMECASKAVPAKEDMFEYDVNVLVYGDKIAFVDFSNERAYILANQRTADFHRAIFRLLFSHL